MTFVRRVSVAGAGALALALGSTTPSHAKDRAPPAECASAYADGLMLRQASRPREAQESLLQCARTSCGSLQRKCASAAEQARSEMAWVAPVVTDAKGSPLVDAQVKLDDQPLTSRADGRAIPVDPGLHELSVTARVGPWPGHEVTAKRQVMIVQGQRGPLPISLPREDEEPPKDPAPAAAASAEPAPAPAPAPVEPAPGTHHGPTVWPFVIGGVGVLGLGAGALLTYWGKTDNDALASCSPTCSPSSVDHIRRLYLAADVSFGVGGVALGVATLLLVTTRPSSREAAPSTAVFDVQPTRSGALASLHGVF